MFDSDKEELIEKLALLSEMDQLEAENEKLRNEIARNKKILEIRKQTNFHYKVRNKEVRNNGWI